MSKAVKLLQCGEIKVKKIAVDTLTLVMMFAIKEVSGDTSFIV